MTKKVIVIGLDGLMMDMVKKFADEGNLPVMAELLENGAFAESFSSPPVDTPTNWTSLATGAWTGTHGLNTFGIHKPGEPFEHFHNVNANVFPRLAGIAEETLNGLCNAEYIWQAAERAGKKCLLVNFPGGWPPNIKSAIVVDGSGPLSSPLCRLSSETSFDARRSPGRNQPPHLEMELVPAKEWIAPPFSHSPLLEGVLPLVAEKPSEVGLCSPPLYHFLVIDDAGQGYNKIILSKQKNARAGVTLLPGENELSPWITEVVELNLNNKFWGFLEKRVKLRLKFKIKFSMLSRQEPHVRFYRTAIYNTEGWASPQAIADELIAYFWQADVQKTGEEIGQAPRISPFAQVYETIPDQARGVARTCKYLANNYDWDLLLCQIHAPDGLNHEKLSGICPDTPLYDPLRAEEIWEEFRAEYRVLDQAVGKITQDCSDPDTVVVVVSDHGAVPAFRVVRILDFFVEKGLIGYKADKHSDEIAMDWERSKAILGSHPLAQNVWVNLKGRETQGIVESGEAYEKVRDEVIDTLYEIRDPDNGKCPIALALRKEEAEFMGQWGDRVGDVVYYLKPGYLDDAMAVIAIRPAKSKRLRTETFRPVSSMLAQGGFNPEMLPGAHHAYLPGARMGNCSVRGVFVIAGPGIQKGHRCRAPVWTVDVTPTICHVLGILAPDQSEGKIIREVFEG